jgi:hypothetical protein
MARDPAGRRTRTIGRLILLVGLLGILAPVLQISYGALSRWGLSPYYAQTAWPTLHRDGGNSTYVSLAGPIRMREKWKVLSDAAVLTAPTIGPEGHVYVTTGKGEGFSNLFAFDRN